VKHVEKMPFENTLGKNVENSNMWNMWTKDSWKVPVS
jgi:hypothetical protein